MTARPRTAVRVSILAVVVGLLAPIPGEAQWLDLQVPQRPTADAASVEAGKGIYERRCWFCHGKDGDGNGPVADGVWPRPRDFTTGMYKLRTTASGELPIDEDLFRTISLGIPGTAMPAWQSELSVAQRWQVISYLKTFASDLFENKASDPYKAVVKAAAPGGGGGAKLNEAGKKVFEKAKCWECHGREGRGSGEKAGELKDDWNIPIWPTDLQLAWKVKGGSAARELYLRFSTGLNGTPMPSYTETLTPEERWELANYVASLQRGDESERSSAVVISARRVPGELPSSPDDPAWAAATEMLIPLTGQATFAPRLQEQAVTDLSVSAIYNAEEIALRLTWDDRFADTLAVDSAKAAAAGWNAKDGYAELYRDGRMVRTKFVDGAEIMFPVRYVGGPELPHFVYGGSSQPVDLWRWRADLQHSPNPSSAVTELRASGTQQPPQARPPENQRVAGIGEWKEGRWSVVVRRKLETGDSASAALIRPGAVVPVAFHVWEGANGETGLRMAVSSWYFLHLSQPVPAKSYLLVLLIVAATAAVEYGVVRWVGSLAGRGRLVQYGVRPTALDAPISG